MYLSGHVYSSFFPYYGNFDLARISHFSLNFLGDFKTQFIAVAVSDPDQIPRLPSIPAPPGWHRLFPHLDK